MAKVGIMGGTFNPIHLGHIKLAQTAYEQLKLDTVWFMPSKTPPHKDSKDIVPQEDRVAMINLAIKDFNHFQFSDIELTRDGTTYTSYTMEYLHSLANNDKNYYNDYYFIIGADSLYNIETWNRPEVLFQLTSFAVACRDDVDINSLTYQCNYLKNKYKANIFIINMDKIDISSSYIRHHYRTKGLDYDYSNYIHPDVHTYILKNELYR